MILLTWAQPRGDDPSKGWANNLILQLGFKVEYHAIRVRRKLLCGFSFVTVCIGRE